VDCERAYGKQSHRELGEGLIGGREAHIRLFDESVSSPLDDKFVGELTGLVSRGLRRGVYITSTYSNQAFGSSA
jgi:hypothetical protein